MLILVNPRVDKIARKPLAVYGKTVTLAPIFYLITTDNQEKEPLSWWSDYILSPSSVRTHRRLVCELHPEDK